MKLKNVKQALIALNRNSGLMGGAVQHARTALLSFQSSIYVPHSIEDYETEKRLISELKGSLDYKFFTGEQNHFSSRKTSVSLICGFCCACCYAISLGVSLSHYKTPRSLKLGPIVDLLNSKVVSNHFSPKCPRWAPSKYVTG
ncbi:hypothetical protein POM88_036120 [Heracleum sosnowskyi]|uniref:Uncharacterized protein n=1 Tax=Heracleum sosnowskyi TaxID=360622 RepID=A0AAD8HNM5_9APIA|nr:hypothetical protein POM88_036120 [Heracleum sosnowskyi]